MSNRLEGKVALVTGGARGIGLATVQTLAHEGATVILTDIETELLNMNHGDLPSSILTYPLDVAKESEWEYAISKIHEQFEAIDILVNNAGIGGKEGVEDTSLTQWNTILSVNLTGPFIGMKKVIPIMKRNGSGTIINISSIYGKIGNGEAAAYHAAKAGLAGLTKTAAVELAPFSIRVNTIHPGVIDTPMIKRKLENKNIRQSLVQLTPLPTFGKPEDIAHAVLYLASDESRFVTGSELVVDGGYLAK